MKNATTFGTKLKKLVNTLKKNRAQVRESTPRPPIQQLVLGILHEGDPRDLAEKGLQTLLGEFVDFNELRVAPPKDIVELLGSKVLDGRAKAEMLTKAMAAVFERDKAFDIEYIGAMAKRETKAHLREVLGLSSFAEAFLTLYGLGGSAVPVDARLTEKLVAEGLAHPDSTPDDVRNVLERVVPAKSFAEVFEVLAVYALEPVKPGSRRNRKPRSRAKGAASGSGKAQSGIRKVVRKKAVRKKAAKSTGGKTGTRKKTRTKK